MRVATDINALAGELSAAYASRRTDVIPPSSRDASFDLTAAYAVESELARRRHADGHQTVGRKVGFANKAVWRALKLETLVWASMYDDTVRYATGGAATLVVDSMCSPKIEPEIVFCLGQAGKPGRVGQLGVDAAEVLADVEWLALGFEIIDCTYADWKFQPQDFVASFGLHAALIVGERVRVTPDLIPGLVDQLATFTVQLARNGEVVATGSGRNALRSPALSLGELAAALARRSGAEPLRVGELVSTGTLTESQPIAVGETWTAAVDGLPLPALTLRLDA
jgi:2-keto-4-pentenoate hydratase